MRNKMMVIFIISLLAIGFGKVPPSAPLFDDLKDIDDCKGCIVGKDEEQFKVLCKTAGGSPPIIANISIENESFTALQYDRQPGFMAFFTLRSKHHLKNMSCTVMNKALTVPLKTTTQVYVIKQARFMILKSPETLNEGYYFDIECLVSDARPIPSVYFNISDLKVFPRAHELISDTSFSNWTYHFYLPPFQRHWNLKNISCCIKREWYIVKDECTQSKQVHFLFPPAAINLEIKVEQSLQPQQMYALCTIYDSNPIYQAHFMASSEIIGSELYSRNVSLSNGAWKAEYAVYLNVSEDDNGKEITCVAVCPHTNEILNQSSSVVILYDNSANARPWFYQWIIWTLLGSIFAASVVLLSVCVAVAIIKQKKAKELAVEEMGENVDTKRVYINIENGMYEKLDERRDEPYYEIIQN